MAAVSTARKPRTPAIVFPPDLAQQIERIAEAEDRSFGSAVRQLCRRALESQQEAEPVQAR